MGRRRKGVYPEQIAQWRQACELAKGPALGLAGMSSAAALAQARQLKKMNYSNQLLRKWMEFRKAVRPCLGSVPGRDRAGTGFRTMPNSIRRAPMQYLAARYGHSLCIGVLVPTEPSWPDARIPGRSGQV